MEKFAGNKTPEQIKAQCKAQGLVFDDRRYQTMGDDHVVVRGGGAYAIFNTFNGRFFGTTPDGTEFTSDDTLDGTPWFDALLRFFYVEKKAKRARSTKTGAAS
jgi:hypothetical protein